MRPTLRRPSSTSALGYDGQVEGWPACRMPDAGISPPFHYTSDGMNERPVRTSPAVSAVATHPGFGVGLRGSLTQSPAS